MSLEVKIDVATFLLHRERCGMLSGARPVVWLEIDFKSDLIAFVLGARAKRGLWDGLRHWKPKQIKGTVRAVGGTCFGGYYELFQARTRPGNSL